MLILQAPLFGLKHIIGILFVILLFSSIALIYKKYKFLNDRKILIIFLIVFYILEIIKITYIMSISDWVYPIYQLQLQFCSLPLYLYPLMVIFKDFKFVDKFIKPAAYSLIMLAGLLALIMPVNIIGNSNSWLPLSDNILPIISFIYHGLMIFSSLWLLKSKYYNFNIKNYFNAMVVGLIYATIGMIANVLLDQDYMLLNKGNGSPLQFIIEISKPLYLLTMIGGFGFLVFIVFLVTNLVYNKNKKENLNFSI
ncbi:MAG: YwaF family protein [Candidatus Izemoplasmatales bacterium]|jgi:hypothetical protein|nr:YwaF family protein [Candidatus Izemoplasmatales bacterium]